MINYNELIGQTIKNTVEKAINNDKEKRSLPVLL